MGFLDFIVSLLDNVFVFVAWLILILVIIFMLWMIIKEAIERANEK